ncbi:MAG: peptidoglycan-binding domain-containing protein [Clostridia bacterium]|nr:peptidoglycan-binding domain-containing protein [Clostridia bacterium]
MIVKNTDGKSVRGLQSMLRNISYYVEDVLKVIPDGNFTEDTKNSVISFQKAYGLNPSGEVDNATWDKIRDVNNELNRIYAEPKGFAVFGKRIIVNEGDEIPELYVVQSMLYTVFLNYPNSPEVDITGVHDERSVEAVIFVQNITGLEPTGIIDIPTYNNIADLYTSTVARKV